MRKSLVILVMLLSVTTVHQTVVADVLVWQKPKRPPGWWIDFVEWQEKNVLSDNYRWVIGCSAKSKSIEEAKKKAYTNAQIEITGSQKKGISLLEHDSYFRCYGENLLSNATSFEIFILYKSPIVQTTEEISKQRYEDLVGKGRAFVENGKLLEAQIFFQGAKQLDSQRPIPELGIVTGKIQEFEKLVKMAEEPGLSSKIVIERYKIAKKYAEQFDVPEWALYCDTKIFEYEHGNRYFRWVVAFHEMGPQGKNGFSLVGSEICDRLTENDVRLVFSADINPARMNETELLKLAKERNADILMIGESSVKKSTNRPAEAFGISDIEIFVCHATAMVKIIRVEDEQIELTKTVYTKGFDDNSWEEAGENALKEAGRVLWKGTLCEKVTRHEKYKEVSTK